MEKAISILWGIFMISAFLTQAFGQKELGVMKRYDYSSPKASFESLKKAIQGKDFEGIIIHDWQIFKKAEGSVFYGKSFEDIRVDTTFPRCPPEVIAKMPPDATGIAEMSEEAYQIMGQIWTDDGDFRITEADFVKELESLHSEEGVTFCTILLERKSDGKQVEVDALNYDGTSEWWILIERGGE